MKKILLFIGALIVSAIISVLIRVAVWNIIPYAFSLSWSQLILGLLFAAPVVALLLYPFSLLGMPLLYCTSHCTSSKWWCTAILVIGLLDCLIFPWSVIEEYTVLICVIALLINVLSVSLFGLFIKGIHFTPDEKEEKRNIRPY